MIKYIADISVFFAVSVITWYILYVYMKTPKEISGRRRPSDDEKQLLPLKAVLGMIISIDKKFLFVSEWMNKNRQKYSSLLMRAGLSRKFTCDEFLALKQFAPVIIFSVFFFIVGLRDIMLYVVLMGFGFFLPDIWLKDCAKSFHNKIIRAMPDALDTLALVVSAGVDLGGAIDTYVKGNSGDLLAEEFLRVKHEMDLGVPRPVALESMGKRLGCDTLSDFINTVIQSERMGTSLSETLQNQASVVRMRRFNKAEELGQKAAIKMLAPLLLLIMPNVFIIIIAPIILKAIYNM
jgi:tight adherence protein C